MTAIGAFTLAAIILTLMNVALYIGSMRLLADVRATLAESQALHDEMDAEFERLDSWEAPVA